MFCGCKNNANFLFFFFFADGSMERHLDIYQEYKVQQYSMLLLQFYFLSKLEYRILVF